MNLNDFYKNKYLKYKKKYLELNQQYGGLVNVINSDIDGCKIKYFNNQYYNYFDSVITEKKYNLGKMTIKLISEQIQIIGSGGFGKILLVIPPLETGLDKFIVKLIYKQENCSDASKEFDNIIKVYDAFEMFTELVNPLDTTDAIELKKNLTYLNPLKTYGYYNCEVEYNEEIYNCCIITSYSQGYDVETIIIPNLSESYNEEDKRILKDNYQNILIMPIFPNYNFNKIIIDTKNNKKHLTINDPIRYAKLQINKFGDLGIIRELNYIEKYGKIMGMLQAILLWNAKITTTDLEILTGPKGDSYCYNLIDYGMLEQFEIKTPFNSDDTIDYIINKITIMGGLFFAKPSFPSESGYIFDDFIEYFKRTSKVINSELNDDFFVKFDAKLKETLF